MLRATQEVYKCFLLLNIFIIIFSFFIVTVKGRKERHLCVAPGSTPISSKLLGA